MIMFHSGGVKDDERRKKGIGLKEGNKNKREKS